MRRDLVQRAMRHDHEAFSELARLTTDRLYAIARLILHDDDLGADAVQETLVVAWRDIAALRDPDRFEAWLRRLLVRACYREAGRHRELRRMELQVASPDRSVADASDAVADRDELERAFRRLTPEQRAIIALHYYAGLPMTETAESLGLPIGTVKSRLFRATRTLRAGLDADARAVGRLEERRA